MKRYVILEVPDSYPGAEYWDTRNVYVPVLKGPVELMQAACKEAGVEMLYETVPGNYYLTAKGDWWQAIHPVRWNDYRPVITAPEPEPEKPCPNCQGAESKEKINRMWNKEGTEILCFECGRPESEWTYAKDRWKAEWQVAEPGGIGCGGTGGPL